MQEDPQTRQRDTQVPEEQKEVVSSEEKEEKSKQSNESEFQEKIIGNSNLGQKTLVVEEESKFETDQNS